MSEPFLSEIKMMSFNFAPKGWAMCNGQILPINQNQALFALLGTVYGGNGQSTFGLPNLQGRVPIHMGSGFTLGQAAGEQAHTLIISEIPAHTHFASAANVAATTGVPGTSAAFVLAQSNGANAYAPTTAGNLAAMAPNTISNVGGSQPHQNMEPFLVINFCIALQGIFPSQT